MTSAKDRSVVNRQLLVVDSVDHDDHIPGLRGADMVAIQGRPSLARGRIDLPHHRGWDGAPLARPPVSGVDDEEADLPSRVFDGELSAWPVISLVAWVSISEMLRVWGSPSRSHLSLSANAASVSKRLPIQMGGARRQSRRRLSQGRARAARPRSRRSVPGPCRRTGSHSDSPSDRPLGIASRPGAGPIARGMVGPLGRVGDAPPSRSRAGTPPREPTSGSG